LDYAVADLWQMQQYQVAFKEDRIMLAATLPMLRQLAEPAGAAAPYGVITVQDGVVLMARGQASAPGQLAAWRVLRDQLQQQLIPPK
jgi:malic enzyme